MPADHDQYDEGRVSGGRFISTYLWAHLGSSTQDRGVLFLPGRHVFEKPLGIPLTEQVTRALPWVLQKQSRRKITSRSHVASACTAWMAGPRQDRRVLRKERQFRCHHSWLPAKSAQKQHCVTICDSWRPSKPHVASNGLSLPMERLDLRGFVLIETGGGVNSRPAVH